MKVPFADLSAQHREIAEEMDQVIRDVIERSSFIGGPYVEAFEKEFAEYCGARYAVTCGSGTDALKLALMAAGVGPDEEVVTVPHTFVATIEAIAAVGAHPVFVDIETDTYHLSLDQLGRFLERDCQKDPSSGLINRKTGRAVTTILPVHLYGLPLEMEPLLKLAGDHGLKVVEDAAQAHGARAPIAGGQKMAGAFGLAGAFSFYPGKNLGALGEGGAVITNDPEMDRWMRIWRDHGQSEKYLYISAHGWNLRLDALQCGLLSRKLKRLDQWNECRRRAADWYREHLAGENRIGLPQEPAGRYHIYHVFVVRVPNRRQLQERLLEKGIQTGLHYPIPLHLQKAYEHLGYQEGDFPRSEKVARDILSLPMFPHITEEQVEYVSRTLTALLDEMGVERPD